MHHLMLVTLAMPTGASSQDARPEAFVRLAEDDSFCGEGGRFGSPLCDWFVIGGRWSGLLQQTVLGQRYATAFEAQFPQLAGGWIPESLILTEHDALNALWHRFGGKDGHPFTRSSYEQLGFDDDAMLVDQRLYDHYLTRHAGQDEGDDPKFADLDGDPVDESFIGRKWLVVLDYHN